MRKPRTITAVGLMSGTSGDGISVARVKIHFNSASKPLRVLDFHTFPYDRKMRSMLETLRGASTEEISKAHFRLGILFARAVQQLLRKSPSKVDVIGSHGHTIYHQPLGQNRSTLQIGEPSLLAAKTGIPTVSDFRPMDMAVGGQGAPLVPFFDEFFFDNIKEHICALNIGGIANVTVLPKNRKQITAFDTGPGNCLIDAAMRLISHHRKHMDRNGALAAKGTYDQEILRTLLRHPFLKRKPPKSTDIITFTEDVLPMLMQSRLKKHPEHLIATLTAFTSVSIADAIKRHTQTLPVECVVSGGGALNHTLMDQLRVHLKPITVRSIQEYNIHPLAKEPAAFAVLAAHTLLGIPNNLPSATGARTRAILGKLTLPPI